MLQKIDASPRAERPRNISRLQNGSGAARDFHLESTFSADSLTVSVHLRAHVKDPAVHVRVQWIMKMLKHSACTVG